MLKALPGSTHTTPEQLSPLWEEGTGEITFPSVFFLIFSFPSPQPGARVLGSPPHFSHPWDSQPAAEGTAFRVETCQWKRTRLFAVYSDPQHWQG